MRSTSFCALSCAIFFTACAGRPASESVAESNPASVEPAPADPPAASATLLATDAAAPAAEPDASPKPLETSDAAAPADPVEDAPAPPPKAARYRPVGPCVDPVKHAAKQMKAASPQPKDFQFDPEPTVGPSEDLDGDGQEDQILIGDISVTKTYYVYVMRGACGHFAGRIQADANLAAEGGYTKGLRSLGGLAACRPSCCKTLMHSEYRYDGARFKLAKKESRDVSDCAHGGY